MWPANPSPLPQYPVKNEANGVTRQTPSGADGKFSVSGLPAGNYSIEVSAPSFATSHRSGLKLAAGATENISMALNVGELSQTVTVEGASFRSRGNGAVAKHPGGAFREIRDQPRLRPELRIAGGGLHASCSTWRRARLA